MKQQPRIKICGLKDVQTIEAMDGLPIHEIGFVFAPSKRRVDLAKAGQLIAAVHRLKASGGERPLATGVFVNATFEEIKAVLTVAPLDIVQMHGSEDAALCSAVREQLGVHVWKVFSIKRSSGNVEPVPALEQLSPYKGAVNAILIDAPGGGTGHMFDWKAINEYNQAAGAIGIRLYVAGGLNADNVQELLRTYAPDGIDVSSGVETDGRKDIDKIKLFVRRVMEA